MPSVPHIATHNVTFFLFPCPYFPDFLCACVSVCTFIAQEEEDIRHYCASLFAVPVSRGRTEAQITTPEPCLVIEVLDDVRMTKAFYFNRNVLPT